MAAGDQRSHFSGGIHAVADDDFVAGIGQTWEESVGKSALEEQARTGAANLALAGIDSEERIFQRHVEVGVGDDNVRTFATQFERYLFQISRGSFHDLAAGRSAA